MVRFGLIMVRQIEMKLKKKKRHRPIEDIYIERQKSDKWISSKWNNAFFRIKGMLVAAGMVTTMKGFFYFRKK